MECRIKFDKQARYLRERKERCTYNSITKQLIVIGYGGQEMLFYKAEPDGNDFIIYEDFSVPYKSSSFGLFGHYTGNVVETEDIIYTPFTQQQVVNLNNYQKSGKFHPFTCGNKDDHFVDDDSSRILVATKCGWICPVCWDVSLEGLQNWAHSFMGKPST